MAHTRCLNSAERLPLFDSSMFITFVLVPRMLNLRELSGEGPGECAALGPQDPATPPRADLGHGTYPRRAATSPESLRRTGEVSEPCPVTLTPAVIVMGMRPAPGTMESVHCLAFFREAVWGLNSRLPLPGRCLCR